MIRGYLGEFGSGKTLNMVWDLMQAMYRGRRVISNTPIELFYDPFLKKKKYIKAEFIQEGDRFQWALEHRENCILAIDEAAVYLPSSYWNRLPAGLIVKFAQQRKYRTDFYYTSQVYGHAIKRLRDLTHVVYLCKRKMLFPRIPLPWKKKIVNQDDGDTWYKQAGLGPLQIFIARKFNPAYLHGEPNEKKYKRFYWGSRTLYPSQVRRVFRAYNTNYVVDMSAMMKVKGFVQPTWDKGPDGIETPENATGSVEENIITPQVVLQKDPVDKKTKRAKFEIDTSPTADVIMPEDPVQAEQLREAISGIESPYAIGEPHGQPDLEPDTP
jgi:hypothetical protein